MSIVDLHAHLLIYININFYLTTMYHNHLCSCLVFRYMWNRSANDRNLLQTK